MSNKKKLLIYAHYYIPDTASTGQILRELAEGMLDKFDITVICVVPSYLGTIEDKYKTQKYSGSFCRNTSGKRTPQSTGRYGTGCFMRCTTRKCWNFCLGQS